MHVEVVAHVSPVCITHKYRHISKSGKKLQCCCEYNASDGLSEITINKEEWAVGDNAHHQITLLS
jgi:hypothetical protein